jgi:hypothetical protein
MMEWYFCFIPSLNTQTMEWKLCSIPFHSTPLYSIPLRSVIYHQSKHSLWFQYFILTFQFLREHNSSSSVTTPEACHIYHSQYHSFFTAVFLLMSLHIPSQRHPSIVQSRFKLIDINMGVLFINGTYAGWCCSFYHPVSVWTQNKWYATL